MPNLNIECPTCKKKSRIEITEESMKNVTKGLLAISIAANTICEHNFIVYVDKNFTIRDYFIADFQFQIPQISPKQRIQADKIPTKDIIDIDLIRLNLHAILLVNILKSIFCKQKILIISEQEFLYSHIINFFNYITQDTFDPNISLTTEEDYNKNAKQYKDYMVFSSTNIIRNYKKIINPKKIELEKQIVSKFFSESELGFGYILLKNEISKAYELSKSIVDFISEEKKKSNRVNILMISKNLKEIYNVKIDPMYLDFLIGIVEEYFGVSVPSISSSFFDAL